MEDTQIHLSDEDLMVLLQGLSSNGGLINFFRNKFLKKKPNMSQNHYEHLIDCEKCIYDLWDAYLSLETILEIEKIETLTKLQLTFDSMQSSFQTKLKEGFLLFNFLAPVPVVRSENLHTAGYYTHAKYTLVLPQLKNLLVNFEIESTVSGIKFNVALKKSSDSFICLFFYDGRFRESQNVVGGQSTFPAHFFLHHDDIDRGAKVSFALQKNSQTESHEFLIIII